MNMNDVQVYEPEFFPYGPVQYFCDDQGRDFYESLPLFTKKFVILYDEYGAIRACVPSGELDRLYPVGFSISDINSLPEGFDYDGTWVFRNNRIQKLKYDPAIPTSDIKRKERRAIATELDSLRDAVDTEEATVDEVRRFNALRKYSVALNRVDDNLKNEDVDWPTVPTA